MFAKKQLTDLGFLHNISQQNISSDPKLPDIIHIERFIIFGQELRRIEIENIKQDNNIEQNVYIYIGSNRAIVKHIKLIEDLKMIIKYFIES